LAYTLPVLYLLPKNTKKQGLLQVKCTKNRACNVLSAMPVIKPDFPEPHTYTESEYMQVLAAKQVAEDLLAEAREIIALRDEQIEILRAKAAKAAQLQSQLDNMRYEIEYLQDMIEKGEQKNSAGTAREHEMMDELKQGAGRLQQMGTLQEQYDSAQKQLKIFKQEADELAALNRELLEELKKIPLLQSSLEMEKQANRVLQDKLAGAEKAGNA
jgi:chromosome segregation ATPase